MLKSEVRKDMAVIYVSAVLAVFAGDLWIKNRIEKSREEKLLCGGRIRIHKYHNRGAMLNLGQGRRQLVAAASLALSVMLTILFLFSLGQKGNHLLRTGLALLLGGAFSNTYDRLKRQYVVDYLSFCVKWKPLRRIVFNVSDFCIMIGAMCIVIAME